MGVLWQENVIKCTFGFALGRIMPPVKSEFNW